MISDTIIPYKYSFIGHFSSLYMLIPAYIAYKKDMYSILFSCIFLYITTNLFWSNIKEGPIKKLDFLAVISFSLITGIETFRKCKYFYMYWIISAINVSLFVYNKYINYFAIISKKNEVEPHLYIELIFIHTLTLHICQPIALYYVIF